MRCITHGKHFRRLHIWFEENVDFNSISESVDEIYIHGIERMMDINWGNCEKQHSLVSNLSSTEDELLKLMTKTYRNEINRAIREEVAVKFFWGKDIIDDTKLLQSFSDMYHGMYAEKGMKVFLGDEEIRDYAKAEKFLISVAYIDNIPVVFHSYIIDIVNSRLLHSCSEFREIDNQKRNAIGRANKYLHWMDLRYLKKRGIEKYDWGGCASFEEPNGIDKFKMAFGGSKITYYNIVIYKSFKARVKQYLVKIINLKKIIKHYKESKHR